MDEITVDDGSCDHQMGPTTVTTTGMSPTTTVQPSGLTSATIAAIVLASLLGMALVVIGILSYQIYKTKKLIALDSQDMTPIVVNEH